MHIQQSWIYRQRNFQSSLFSLWYGYTLVNGYIHGSRDWLFDDFADRGRSNVQTTSGYSKDFNSIELKYEYRVRHAERFFRFIEIFFSR